MLKQGLQGCVHESREGFLSCWNLEVSDKLSSFILFWIVFNLYLYLNNPQYMIRTHGYLYMFSDDFHGEHDFLPKGPTWNGRKVAEHRPTLRSAGTWGCSWVFKLPQCQCSVAMSNYQRVSGLLSLTSWVFTLENYATTVLRRHQWDMAERTCTRSSHHSNTWTTTEVEGRTGKSSTRFIQNGRIRRQKSDHVQMM